MPKQPSHTPAIVWIVTACVAIVGANALGLGPVAPAIAAGFDETTTRVLRASAAYGLGTAAGALFLARYIDSTGAQTMLRISLSTLVVALLCSAAAGNSGTLVASQFIAGLAAGIILPACYTVAAGVSRPGDENRILGIVLTGWTISLVAGVTISALLAEWLHWRALFVAMAALAGSVLSLIWNRAPSLDTPGQAAPSPLAALRVPGVPMLLLRVGLYMMAFYGVYAYLGDHVVKQFEMGVSANAWLSASYGIGFGLAALIDRVLDWLGPRRAISWSLLILTLVYVMLAVASQRYGFLLFVALLWGVVNHLAINALIAALGAADPTRRGTVLGLYSATTYLCMSAATLGFGLLYDHTSFPALCYCAAVFCALAAINRPLLREI
jgi:predicted MFS family arabinose efflux permease